MWVCATMGAQGVPGERLIIVRLRGGLGNQMFQYACGRAVSARTGGLLTLDLHGLLDRRPRAGFTCRDFELHPFRIRIDLASPREVSWLGPTLGERLWARLRRQPVRSRRVLRERLPGAFRSAVLTTPGPVLLDGYWQDARYFEDIAGVLREEFRLWQSPVGDAAELEREMLAGTSVCVHVRRGDFLNFPEAVLPVEYFRRAHGLIRQLVPEASFWVYSDDVAWCREALGFLAPRRIVGEDAFGGSPALHQYLMSCCHHFVVSNSTFSWWAAWLGAHPGKRVIAPARWFRSGDVPPEAEAIVPRDWIRL